MSRGRAYRRHQLRLAKRRAYYFVRRFCLVANEGWKEPDLRSVGMNAAVHCKPCSAAWCCGNARTVEGPTRKEVLSAVSEGEQRREVGLR